MYWTTHKCRGAATSDQDPLHNNDDFCIKLTENDNKARKVSYQHTLSDDIGLNSQVNTNSTEAWKACIVNEIRYLTIKSRRDVPLYH